MTSSVKEHENRPLEQTPDARETLKAQTLSEVAGGSNGERRRGFSVREQLNVLVPLAFVWSFGFFCLAAVALSGDVGEYTLDPSWLSGAAWYAGAISQLGAICWTVAGTSAIFGALLARYAGRAGTSRFLFVGAFSTAVLLLDDLFGFHSGLFIQLGIGKHIGESLIVAPLAVWIIRYRREILRTRYQLLGASIVANFVSLFVDVFVNPGRFDFALLFEDGPKFLGILAWATYFIATVRDISWSVLGQISEQGRSS